MRRIVVIPRRTKADTVVRDNDNQHPTHALVWLGDYGPGLELVVGKGGEFRLEFRPSVAAEAVTLLTGRLRGDHVEIHAQRPVSGAGATTRLLDLNVAVQAPREVDF